MYLLFSLWVVIYYQSMMSSTINYVSCFYFLIVCFQVEIQMFGPYRAGGKQVYVAIALDSYSQFPEATIMEVLSSATLTNFVLNLFCR